MLVFAFAITPKRFLHNLLVSHKDSFKQITEGKTEISKASFHCQCDNLVATSPFTATDEKPDLYLPFIFVSYQVDVSSTNLSPAHPYFKLRGPPALI